MISINDKKRIEEYVKIMSDEILQIASEVIRDEQIRRLELDEKKQ